MKLFDHALRIAIDVVIVGVEDACLDTLVLELLSFGTPRRCGHCG
jgi:hypothetical protein